MASIVLKKIPDELHLKVKRLQLDYESEGIKKSLEDIYIELIISGFEKKNPSK